MLGQLMREHLFTVAFLVIAVPANLLAALVELGVL